MRVPTEKPTTGSPAPGVLTTAEPRGISGWNVPVKDSPFTIEFAFWPGGTETQVPPTLQPVITPTPPPTVGPAYRLPVDGT
jgi:hypothetical protein